MLPARWLSPGNNEIVQNRMRFNKLGYLHIQVKREADSEVVSVREGLQRGDGLAREYCYQVLPHLLSNSRPLLGDDPNLLPGLNRQHLELHILAAAAHRTEWALDPEDRLTHLEQSNY